jgi:hypothetical protein
MLRQGGYASRHTSTLLQRQANKATSTSRIQQTITPISNNRSSRRTLLYGHITSVFSSLSFSARRLALEYDFDRLKKTINKKSAQVDGDSTITNCGINISRRCHRELVMIAVSLTGSWITRVFPPRYFSQPDLGTTLPKEHCFLWSTLGSRPLVWLDNNDLIV